MSVINCEMEYRASIDDEVYCKEVISQITDVIEENRKEHDGYRHKLFDLEDFQFRRADNHQQMRNVNEKCNQIRECLSKLLQFDLVHREKRQEAEDRLTCVQYNTKMKLQQLQIALRREAGIYDHPWQDVDSGVFKSVTT
jgi:hypothetical protein